MKIQLLTNNYAKFVPVLAPIVLVILQALVDNNIIHFAPHVLGAINSVVVAFGLHSLNIRTK